MLTPTPRAPQLIRKWLLLKCRDVWGAVLKEHFCEDLSVWVFLRLAQLEGNRTSFTWRSLRAWGSGRKSPAVPFSQLTRYLNAFDQLNGDMEGGSDSHIL